MVDRNYSFCRDILTGNGDYLSDNCAIKVRENRGPLFEFSYFNNKEISILNGLLYRSIHKYILSKILDRRKPR